MRIVIREAAAADDHDIGELLVQSFVEQYAKKLPEVTVSERRMRELRDVAGKRSVAKVWVACVESLVVGTVAIWPFGSERSEAFIEGAFDLRHLAVHSAWRGKNVSQLLLDEAERYAKSRRAPAVCLHVRRGALGVKRLYESRGYVCDPTGDIDALPEVYLEALFLRFAPPDK
jgi:GNAT superfamily N-acetyltransferase